MDPGSAGAQRSPKSDNLKISFFLGILALIFLAAGVYQKDAKTVGIGGSLAFSIVTLWKHSSKRIIPSRSDAAFDQPS